MKFEGSAIDVAGSVFEYSGGKETIALKMGEGWSASGSGSLTGEWPVVFVAGKAGAKELGSLDVAGKIVVFMPLAEAASGARGNRASRPSRDLASKAAGVFTVNDVAAARLPTASSVVPKSARPAGAEGGAAQKRVPTLALSTAAAKSLAASAGVDLDKLAASAAEAPVSKAGKGKIKVNLTTETKEIPVPNVIGSLEGSDPTLKSEVVIIGSHLDHLGRNAAGEIFNGADDDGSGSTGLLAVTRAFAKNGVRPKRTMVFLAVCGEEMGLLGSGYYVDNPIFPIEKTVAEFQMDMIGRNEEHHPSENPTNEKAEENINTLHLIGSKKLSTQLHDIIDATNTNHIGFVFEYDQEGVYFRSDHYNFAKKGIPISFYFSGFHPDYHRTTDDVEKIDFTKLSRTAKLVYLSAYEVANRDARVVVDKKPEPERRRRG
jgi:Zn-dependent M28 family amino/carboxypeptidase